MNPLQIRVDISHKDHRVWSEYVIFQSKEFKRNSVIFAWSFPVFVVILLGYKWANQNGEPIETLVFLIIAGLWAAFYPKRYAHLNRSRIRRRLENDPDMDKHLGEHLYTINEQGIQVESQNSKSEIKWSGISSWTETDDYIFLLLNKKAALPFPKEQISGVDLKDLREIASSKIA